MSKLPVPSKGVDYNPILRLYWAIEDNRGEYREYLVGRILTIVDASISDSVQRKALKDVVREALYSQHFFNERIADMVIEFVNKFAKEIKPLNGSELEIMGLPVNMSRLITGEYFK